MLDVVCEPRKPPEQKSHTARDRKRKPGNPPTPRQQPEARRRGATQRLDGTPESQAGGDAESKCDERARLLVVESGKRENGDAGHENRRVEGREDRRLEERKGRHREEKSRDQRDGRREGPCREQPDKVHRQDSLEQRSNGYGDSSGSEERDEGHVQITFEGTEASSRVEDVKSAGQDVERAHACQQRVGVTRELPGGIDGGCANDGGHGQHREEPPPEGAGCVSLLAFEAHRG